MGNKMTSVEILLEKLLQRRDFIEHVGEFRLQQRIPREGFSDMGSFFRWSQREDGMGRQVIETFCEALLEKEGFGEYKNSLMENLVLFVAFNDPDMMKLGITNFGIQIHDGAKLVSHIEYLLEQTRFYEDLMQNPRQQEVANSKDVQQKFRQVQRDIEKLREQVQESVVLLVGPQAKKSDLKHIAEDHLRWHEIEDIRESKGQSPKGERIRPNTAHDKHQLVLDARREGYLKATGDLTCLRDELPEKYEGILSISGWTRRNIIQEKQNNS